MGWFAATFGTEMTSFVWQLNDENAAAAYRGDYNDDHPSIEEAERPAITQHLARVYEEVLLIAPTSISGFVSSTVVGSESVGLLVVGSNDDMWRQKE